MYAQPVPVRGADNQEQPEEVSSEEEDADTDPTYLVPQGHGRFALRWSRLATAADYLVPQGHGRFALRWSRLATAADNFAKGNAQTESTTVSSWLTSGLEIAMSRMGWFLLSSGQELTRLSATELLRYFH
ncbi:unnamed protein product, partial [Durusdinium trenchii]